MVNIQMYSVISFDESNGAVFLGIAAGAVLKRKFPDAFSPNEDGLFILDEDESMFAVPCDGKTYEDSDVE